MRGLVFLGDEGIELRACPEPRPGPGHVRVRITRAAVCGTDLHKRRRPPERQPRHADGRPVISGHEPVGIVDAIGKGVSPQRMGDRVVVAGVFGCGDCGRCKQGFNTACEGAPGALHATADGSNADWLIAPAANALSLPSTLGFDDAVVLACAGGTAMTALEDASVTSDDQVAVVGLGAVGLATVLLARSLGAAVVGFDPNPRRRALAESLGAQSTVDPNQVEAASVRLATGRCGFDVVVECAGTGARGYAGALARRRGRVALAGLGTEAWAIDPVPNALSLIGIAATPLACFRPLIDRTARLRLPFASIVSHTMPLEDAARAFDLMERGEATKVVFHVAD